MKIINYKKSAVGKYQISYIRIFGIKIEWCFYHKKYSFRLEINNWDN